MMKRNLPLKAALVATLYFLALVTGCVKTMASEGEETDIDFHDRNYGASAAELLRDDRFTSLRVEIQYMPGYAPDGQALVNLEQFLEQHLHKPEGIVITTKEIEAATDERMTRAQVVATERANRTAFANRNQLAVYILYTNGHFQNPRQLGEAYRNTSAVLYGKAIRQSSGKIGRPSRTKLESVVLLHEMGHLLGLVNKGAPARSDHADTSREGHCENSSCLMFYAVETNDRFGHLRKGTVPELDASCLADLRAAGGK